VQCTDVIIESLPARQRWHCLGWSVDHNFLTDVRLCMRLAMDHGLALVTPPCGVYWATSLMAQRPDVALWAVLVAGGASLWCRPFDPLFRRRAPRRLKQSAYCCLSSAAQCSTVQSWWWRRATVADEPIGPLSASEPKWPGGITSLWHCNTDVATIDAFNYCAVV